MGKKCKIRIGTSGWHYDHWIGRFYPDNLKKSDWLDYFARTFNTVEINNTFYHLPKDSTINQWYKQSPEDFVFTIKASRYITHIKRLSDPAYSIAKFFDIAKLFKQKLGPVLYQLPPNFHKDLPRLDIFLTALPKTSTSVFEFRHESWFDDDTYDLLKKHNAAFCIHDHTAAPTSRIITSDNIYIRLHGSNKANTASYSNKELAGWAEWINSKRKEAAAIYIYFNNDINAYAIKNAKSLSKMTI